MEEINNENLNSTNETDEVVTETTDTESDTTTDTSDEVDVEKLKEQNKKLFARAKRAEGFELVDGKWIKKAKPQEKKPEKKDNINRENEYLTREEAILIAKGEDEESLSKLKLIAKGQGISLLEAQKDEMFVLWKEKRESEVRKSKAKLGASHGSGSQRPQKSVSEMSRDEHIKHVMDTLK